MIRAARWCGVRSWLDLALEEFVEQAKQADAMVIGYYVHHQGTGHLHRALSISKAWSSPLTGLSTHGRPAGWDKDWLKLPDDAGGTVPLDPTAHGRLHYVPYGNAGLLERMAAVAGWLDWARPAAMVVDVSVEVSLLARLHGVPVFVMAQPGERHDVAHRLAYDLAEAIIVPWPREAGGLWGATPDDLAKAHFVGAVARFPPTAVRPPTGSPRVVVLNGTGGAGARPAVIEQAREATPGWEWIHLDRAHGTWVDDPWPILCSASVVISHAGQNAIAEIAAARRPALVIPQERPFAEQQVMGAALSSLDWVPALVRADWPTTDEWPGVLDRLLELDGGLWSGWSDGHGATRVSAMLADFASGEQAVPA